MPKIFVIGLGPGDKGELTLHAAEILGSGVRVYLRTEKHPAVEYLREKDINYETYDSFYDKGEDFLDVYKSITKDLIEKAKTFNEISYCVPGHPLVAEKTVSLLLEAQERNEIEVEIISGLSFIEPMLVSLGIDPVDGLKIIDGLNLVEQVVEINTDNFITQVYNRMRASDLKLRLMEIYGDEYEVYVIKSAGIREEEKIVKIPLYELDRLDWIDYLTSIYIPKIDKNIENKYDFFDLMGIMETLRGKNGCEWDKIQTHESLRPYLIEEAYEVVDAIDNGTVEDLAEELGDLLLQIVFHSQIGREEGTFNIYDVTTLICQKMIRRHPKVFTEFLRDGEEVVYDWNDIKAKEKDMSSYTDRMKSVPKGLPALIKSAKIQNRAAEVGFDWPNIEGALEKIEEELGEVREEISTLDKVGVEEEIGDLLFSIVNVTRFLNIDPETALNKATNKFIKRFEIMEKECIRNKWEMKILSLKQLDELWECAKEKEKYNK